MYENLLLHLGLNENEAKMYELLLSRGETKARELLEGSGLGRGNVYNVLTSLIAKGLVEMSAGKQQHYKAVEPSRLRTLAELRRRQVEAVEGELSALLPGMTSLYNLSTSRPVVEVFEGLEGVERGLADTLTVKGEILAYVDVGTLEGDYAEINTRYSEKRLRMKIEKRILSADTSEHRQWFASAQNAHTQVRFTKNVPSHLPASLQLYDNTLQYIMYTGGSALVIIIRDRILFDFHHQLFELAWREAQTLHEPAQ